MAITDEEQRGVSAIDWALNSTPAGGPVVPSTSEPPVAQDDDGLLDQPMTLQEHLKELRDRLIKAVLGVALGMVGGFFVASRILDYWSALLKRADPNAQLIQTSPTEFIVVFFKIAFYMGIALAMPILVYQFIRFLAPGLTRMERRYVYAMMPFVMLFFVLGVGFASLVAIPNMFHFLLLFSAGRAANFIRVEEMLGFFLNLSLWTGVTFEMPIVMFVLASVGIVPYEIMRKARKYASVGLMILAAVITPTPDPINMLIVWAPMYLLFELGLVLARFAPKRRRDQAVA